jgi:cytochrome P450
MIATGLRLRLSPLPTLDAMASCPARRVETSPGEYLVWDPAALAEIFRTDGDMTHPPSATWTPMFGERSMILTVDRDRHREYRRLLAPHLRGPALRPWAPVVREAVEAELGRLRSGTIVHLPAWTRGLTLRVTARIVLGHADPRVLAAFTTWVESALGSRRRLLMYRYGRLHAGLPSPWRRFLRRRDEVDRLLVRSIREAPPGDPPSLAERLLAADGPLEGIDDAELRDQLVSLLFAGHETTASAIAWTLCWIQRSETARRDLLAELEATPGDGADADTFPRLDAACREALRLSPPVITGTNRSPADGNRGHIGSMPGATTVTPCIYLAHRDPETYHDPEAFDPRRFAGARYERHRYLPFGGGVRRCLGSDLAMMEMRIVVAAILRRPDVRFVGAGEAVPQVRGLAMAPSAGLWMAISQGGA